MMTPSEPTKPATTRAAAFVFASLAEGGGGVALPSAPGALAEADGGCDAPPPGVVDGDGAMGSGGEPGVVAGAGPGAEAAGDGGEVGVAAGAGRGAAPEGGGDEGLSAGAAAGGGEDGLGRGAGDGGDIMGGAPGGVRAPVRSARTTTMSFSLARQLASLPLMKKKGPERSSVNTVLPSSNFWRYDEVLHALYAAGSTRSTESVSLGYTNTARTGTIRISTHDRSVTRHGST
jgi:hypothetical protein